MPYRSAGPGPRTVLVSAVFLLLTLPALPAAGGPVDEPATVIDVEPSAEGWQPYVECQITCPPPPVLRGSQPTQLTVVGERVFFSAFTFAHGRELWVSDGSAAGTRLVMDGCAGPCSGNPVLVGRVAGELVFWIAEDEEHGKGRYFRTDGTADGTEALPGVCPGGCHNSLASYGQDVRVGLEFDGSLFFLAPAEDGGWPVLWRTDGGAAETVTLAPSTLGWPGGAPLTVRADDLEAAVVARDGLYLLRQPDLLSDQPPVLLRFPAAAADPQPVVAGCDRWVNFPRHLRPGPGGVAFVAGCLDAPGLRVADDSSSLFLTDGTTAGTRLLFTGEGTGHTARRAVPLGWVGQALFFGVDDGAAEAGELWVSYGRPDSTLQRHTGLPRLLGGFVHGGAVLLRAYRENSWDPGLWSFLPDSGQSPRELVAEGVHGITPVGASLLFSAVDEAGREPWISDGTPDGTHRLIDLNPGPGDSSPRDFAAADRVYLSADDGLHDQELVALDEALVDPDRCATGGDNLCLADGRFRVRLRWTNQHDGGAEGVGQALKGTGKAGFFWFFREANLEVVVKVLDGTGINGHHWVFWGGITDLEYDLEVTDLESGETRIFHHAPGDLCGGADTTAFAATEEDVAADGAAVMAELTAPSRAMTPAPPPATSPLSPPPCGATETRLCLGGGWGFFGVEASYTNHYAGNARGQAKGVAKGNDSGYFWFFNPENPELMVKVLYGGEVNDHWWVFIGGLTTLETEVTITDTSVGGPDAPSRTYVLPADSTCGIADLEAFPE